MSRTKGLISFSGNFEPRMAEPFDGRIRVETYSDLTKLATWINDDGNIYLYKEIIVSVYNDSNVENNGAYRLVDNNYTIADNWVKIGSDVEVIVNHDDLTPESREMANQHPISAITGLQDELDSKLNKDNTVITSTVIYNAPNNINYIVVGDTTTTINLPSTPTNFSDVKIVDSRGDASVNNITINGNGKNINDDTSVIIDTNFGYVNMRYIDNKWVIYNIG